MVINNSDKKKQLVSHKTINPNRIKLKIQKTITWFKLRDKIKDKTKVKISTKEVTKPTLMSLNSSVR